MRQGDVRDRDRRVDEDLRAGAVDGEPRVDRAREVRLTARDLHEAGARDRRGMAEGHRTVRDPELGVGGDVEGALGDRPGHAAAVE